MATFQTLANISIEKLLAVFNWSFSDYVIPFRLTKEQLENKIKDEGIRLDFSAGAFENNQLIAFVLHGYDIIDNLKIAYNAGTGVIPDKRGHKLTAQLYDYILPVLRENNVDKVMLEVITTNERAIKTYQNIGFKTVRQFNCYKGSLQCTTNNDVEIRKLESYDWQKFYSFWDIKPSWQNSVTIVEKMKASNVSVGAYLNDKLLGYVIFNPNTKRIHQLAVDKNYRRKGVGRQLLGFIATNYAKDIAAINIDVSAEGIFEFMKACGMYVPVMQYEMMLLPE